MITLWTNDKDYIQDKSLFSEDGIIVQRYSGQRGKITRDHLISQAKYFVGGTSGKRQLIGEIIGVTEIDKKETRLFILIIRSNNDKLTFKTKNDLCKHYGWSNCDSNMFGITKHFE
jgi:hypothetical protein